MDVPAGFSPFEPQGPFLEHIGPIQMRHDDDGPVFGLRAEARHTNHRGTIQGGLLSTFADFALGRAIEAGAEDGKHRATVSLTVDFLRPAKPAAWWQAVGLRDDVPAAIAALAAGRTCVELSYAEVKHAVTWASRVDGWFG